MWGEGTYNPEESWSGLAGFKEGLPAPPSLLKRHTGTYGAACPQSSIGSIPERSKWPRQSHPLQRLKEDELGERSTKQVKFLSYSGRASIEQMWLRKWVWTIQVNTSLELSSLPSCTMEGFRATVDSPPMVSAVVFSIRNGNYSHCQPRDHRISLHITNNNNDNNNTNNSTNATFLGHVQNF